MKAPIIPQQLTQPAEEAMLEVKRAVNGLKEKPADGVLTGRVTLGASGSVQTVMHRLGRKPQSWHISGLIGYMPELSITSVDEKRITFTSFKSFVYDSSFSFWVW